MTVIPRAAWQSPSNPVTGPSPTPAEWEWNTLHWPGGNVSGDPAAVLRNMQASWTSSKGYSLGYNFAVWPDGSTYEIRGFDIRCAANGSQDVNRPGVAILLAVPNVNTAPTDAMVAAVRELVAQTRARVPQTLIVNGHRDVRPEPTQCAGDTIMAMIAAGAFEPDAAPAPTPTPEGDDMAGLAYYRDDRADGWQIWVVSTDAAGNVWTCPINDLPDGGKWDVVQPVVGDPPVRPFGALVGLMDRQNRPG